MKKKETVCLIVHHLRLVVAMQLAVGLGSEERRNHFEGNRSWHSEVSDLLDLWLSLKNASLVHCPKFCGGD